MNDTQRQMLGWYRDAIRLHNENPREAATLKQRAYDAEGTWRDDAFNVLEQGILAIWHKCIPRVAGRYHGDVWKPEKEQPPRPTVERLLCEFDALVATSEDAFPCEIAECKTMDGKPSHASFLCNQCHRQICLHPHLRRRQIEGVWIYVCVECLPAFDQARKVQKAGTRMEERE